MERDASSSGGDASARLQCAFSEFLQPMTESVARNGARRAAVLARKPGRGVGVLLAAHGERGEGADNQGVIQLAERLAERIEGAAVEIGFLKGSPSISDAVQRLADYDMLVYPLFLSDGYFTRALLPRHLEEAGAFARGRATGVLVPLGLDPALADLILDRASSVVRAQGWPIEHTDLVLLAHGSGSNPASRVVTERIAGELALRRSFARVRPAFLEETPGLEVAVATSRVHAVVVGLFAGEGLHGGKDTSQLIAELACPTVAFAGNVGGFAALPDLIAAALRRQWDF